MVESSPPRLGRRDLLIALAVGGGAAAAVKGAFAWQQRRSTSAPRNTPTSLTAATGATLLAASLAVAGPAARAAYDRGEYDPLAWAQTMLDAMPDAQRRMVRIALVLFEHARLGLAGFTRLGVADQEAQLAAWRDSRLGFRRSVWGLLHAVGSSAFAQSHTGWAWMRYPGPCRSDVGYPGRAPGQSAPVDWNDIVP